MAQLVCGYGYQPRCETIRATIKRKVTEAKTALRLFFHRRRRAQWKDVRDRSIRAMSSKALSDIGLGRVYDRTFRVPE